MSCRGCDGCVEPHPEVLDDDTPTLCAECRHWGGEPDSFALGPCLVSGSFRAPGGLLTERDFGCIHGRKS